MLDEQVHVPELGQQPRESFPAVLEADRLLPVDLVQGPAHSAQDHDTDITVYDYYCDVFRNVVSSGTGP